MSRDTDLDYQLDRFAARLPDWAGRFLQWLRQPSSAWARYPLSLALIAGGILSFLPILGIWMLPLGLVLIAQDVPFMRAPLARLLAWIERKWPPKKSRSA